MTADASEIYIALLVGVGVGFAMGAIISALFYRHKFKDLEWGLCQVKCQGNTLEAELEALKGKLPEVQ